MEGITYLTKISFLKFDSFKLEPKKPIIKLVSLNKLILVIFGVCIGIFFHDSKIPNLNDFLYLAMGTLFGYFLFNFIPFYFKVDEEAKSLTDAGKKDEPPPTEIYVKKIFKASVFGDPITPDEVIFDKKGVTFNVKEVFGNTESFVLYSDISGVEIVEGILLSTIKIKPKTRNTDIKIDNFSKSEAKLIKKLILEKL